MRPLTVLVGGECQALLMDDEGRDELRVAEFGFPGELRDRLVAAVLTGEKTATTGLQVEWELDGGPVPRPGERLLVVDSSEVPRGGRRVGGRLRGPSC